MPERAAAAQALRLAEQPACTANVRRNARAEPDRPRRWRSTHDALWAHVQPYLAAGARVAVVDAANGDDLPLTPLARHSAQVAVIDLDAHATGTARRRERREDDREQARGSGGGLLQQLETGVVGELLGGDPGADDQRGEEGAAEVLGQQPAGERVGHCLVLRRRR